MKNQCVCVNCGKPYGSMEEACCCEMEHHKTRVLNRLRSPSKGMQLTASPCNDLKRVKVYSTLFRGPIFALEVSGQVGRELALAGEFEILADWLEENPESWGLGYEIEDLIEWRLADAV